jgi:hypothetical protein
MSNTWSYSHPGTIGDVWASLPAVKCGYEKYGKKGVYLLMRDIPAVFYDKAFHPTKNEKGVQVKLNQEMIDMIIPLLKAQTYISDSRVHDIEDDVTISLGAINETFVNMPNHSLSKWYFYVYPDLSCDLSIPYIEVPDTEKDFKTNGKIVISRTERYRNESVNYAFLKKYEDSLIFSGTMREYNNFCMTNDLNIPKLSINNFLELAQALKQSNGLISNQTQIFQIAEGMKIPRAVELCSFAPNVCVQGANGFEFYNDYAAEYFLNRMMGTEKEFGEWLKTQKTAEAVSEKVD